MVAITVIVFLVRRLFRNDTKSFGFESAVKTFTFEFLSFKISLIFLCVFSLAIPSFIMIVVFKDMYKYQSVYKKKTWFNRIIFRHFYYGYVNMCFIYCANILIDKYFSANISPDKGFILYKDSLIDGYNEWHKYVFHFFITPILFVDALYSIEIEKMKALKAKHVYNERIYYFTQAVVAFYLFYALLVALFLDHQIEDLYDSIFHKKTIEKAYKISTYSDVLANLIMLCIFMSLFVGLVDLGEGTVKFSAKNIKNDF